MTMTHFTVHPSSDTPFADPRTSAVSIKHISDVFSETLNDSNDKTEVLRATAFNFSFTSKSSFSRYNNNNHNHNHHETQISNHAYSFPNSAIKSSNTTLVHYHNNNNNTHPTNSDSMPAFTPRNSGCAVCTVLLPAMTCVACRKVRYCSATCQRVD